MARMIGYGGAAGGGKSDALLMAGIVGGLSFPGISVGYFRREYPDLEGPGGAIIRSHELLMGWAKWNGGLRRWRLPTGSILQFCHAKDEKDVFGYQSQQFDIILVDEATQFTRFMIRYLLTRNRATKSGVIPFMGVASNPGNIGHAWFQGEFVDCGQPEQVHNVEVEPGVEEPHIFIPAKLSDNEVLEQRDPGYRATLEAQSEIIRRQLLDGDWDVFAGQYFREFRRERHVIRPFEMPKNWRRFRSIDWGYNDPCAVYWHVIGPDKRVITYRELYVNQTLASEVAKEIVRLSDGEDISYTVASPDMWQKRGQDIRHGESIADEFSKHGVRLTKADNSRVIGWQRMHEFLADAPDDQPYWQIFDNCVNLIRTLPTLIHDEHKVEDVSDKVEDHAAESCRYGLMSRPRPAPEPKQELTGTYAYGELLLHGYTPAQIRKLKKVKIIGRKPKGE